MNVCDYSFFRLNSNRSELSSSEFRNGAHRILPIARIRASDQLSCLRRQLHSKLHFVSRLLQIGTILHFSFVSNSYRVVLSAQLWANPASPSDETKFRLSGNQKNKGNPCIVFVLQLYSHAPHMAFLQIARGGSTG